MWWVVVALPAIQSDFGVTRADAALPYTLAMLGFAGGGVAMGRLADRFGVAVPLALRIAVHGARQLLGEAHMERQVLGLGHVPEVTIDVVAQACKEDFLDIDGD